MPKSEAEGKVWFVERLLLVIEPGSSTRVAFKVGFLREALPDMLVVKGQMWCDVEPSVIPEGWWTGSIQSGPFELRPGEVGEAGIDD